MTRIRQTNSIGVCRQRLNDNWAYDDETSSVISSNVHIVLYYYNTLRYAYTEYSRIVDMEF